MRAFTAPVISAVSLQLSCFPLISFLCPEQWGRAMIAHSCIPRHLVFITHCLYGVLWTTLLSQFLVLNSHAWRFFPSFVTFVSSFPYHISFLCTHHIYTFCCLVPPLIFFSSPVFSSLPLFFPLCWQWVVHTVYTDSGNIVNCFWSVLLCAQSHHSMS